MKFVGEQSAVAICLQTKQRIWLFSLFGASNANRYSLDVLRILPLTVDEELVYVDRTGVVNAEEELIGETLDNINGLRR